MEIEERGVKLRLTVVDTPGFGDTIDNADSHQEIIRYIDQQVWSQCGLYYKEFPIPSCKEVFRKSFREFHRPALAV